MNRKLELKSWPDCSRCQAKCSLVRRRCTDGDRLVGMIEDTNDACRFRTVFAYTQQGRRRDQLNSWRHVLKDRYGDIGL